MELTIVDSDYNGDVTTNGLDSRTRIGSRLAKGAAKAMMKAVAKKRKEN